MNRSKGFPVGVSIMNIRKLWRRAVVYRQTKSGFDDDTIMYGRILGFIRQNSDHPVYQKDIEQSMALNKSTVSIILKKLEDKGYLYRASVKEDARLKQILLTDLGTQTIITLGSALDEADEQLIKGLTEEETDTLISLLHKVETNMKELEEKEV